MIAFVCTRSRSTSCRRSCPARGSINWPTRRTSINIYDSDWTAGEIPSSSDRGFSISGFRPSETLRFSSAFRSLGLRVRRCLYACVIWDRCGQTFPRCAFWSGFFGVKIGECYLIATLRVIGGYFCCGCDVYWCFFWRWNCRFRCWLEDG